MSDKDFMKLLFPEVLVKKIEITEITPCLADTERVKFLAQTDKPLGDMLPILYLYIPNAKYSEKLGGTKLQSSTASCNPVFHRKNWNDICQRQKRSRTTD